MSEILQTPKQSSIEHHELAPLPNLGIFVVVPTYYGEWIKGTLLQKINHFLDSDVDEISAELVFGVNFDRSRIDKSLWFRRFCEPNNQDSVHELQKCGILNDDDIVAFKNGIRLIDLFPQMIERKNEEMLDFLSDLVSIQSFGRNDEQNVDPILSKYEGNSDLQEILIKACKKAQRLAISFVDMTDKDFNPYEEGYADESMDKPLCGGSYDTWRTVAGDFVHARLARLSEDELKKMIIFVSDTDAEFNSPKAMSQIYRHIMQNPEIDFMLLPHSYNLPVGEKLFMQVSPVYLLGQMIDYIMQTRGCNTVMRGDLFKEIDSFQSHIACGAYNEDYRIGKFVRNRATEIGTMDEIPFLQDLIGVRVRFEEGTVDCSISYDLMARLKEFQSQMSYVVTRVRRFYNEDVPSELGRKYEVEARAYQEYVRSIIREIFTKEALVRGETGYKLAQEFVDDLDLTQRLYARRFEGLLCEATEEEIEYLKYLVNLSDTLPENFEMNLIYYSMRELFGTYLSYNKIGEEDEREDSSRNSFTPGLAARVSAVSVVMQSRDFWQQGIISDELVQYMKDRGVRSRWAQNVQSI